MFLDIVSGIGKIAASIKGRIKESKEIDKNISEIFGTMYALDDPLKELKKRMKKK